MNKNDILNWLKTLPLDQDFFYQESRCCLLAEYLKSKGEISPRVSISSYQLDNGFNYSIPSEILIKTNNLRDLRATQVFSVQEAIAEFNKRV